ncbi:hypothetical protein [Jutongia sp.]
MLALQGYYDGNSVQTLEKICAQKNQKLVITVLDEFLEEEPQKKIQSARGILSDYADSTMWSKEEDAWKKAVRDRYGNT